MPDCYFLIGPPGCGKSTWREENASSMNDPLIVSSDDRIMEMAKEAGLTYDQVFASNSYSAIVAHLKVNIARAAIAGRDIIIDQTNLTVKKRQLFRYAVPFTYKMIGVVFQYDPEELRARIKEREARTGRAVPDYVLDKMLLQITPPLPNEFDDVIIVPRA